ncbi:MAG: S-methyl-5-thioribose-1-phosphate isomerase [Oscillospiraceae bacterium]
MEINITDHMTVALDDKKSELVIIDQTKLPGKTELLYLRTGEEIWRAINILQVRGAPAIGVAAAYGMYLAAKGVDTGDPVKLCEALKRTKDYLDSARPTAVNLSWATARMAEMCAKSLDLTVPEIKAALLAEAREIQAEDIGTCEAIGEHALTLLKPGDGLLTHCNAGLLATSKYGTATAVMYLGKKRGYNFRVFADETRPLLQGARLTAYELMAAGVDVTLICDGMSGAVMRNGWVDAVFVGCDRVAANGDTANKIGTSVVAAAAKHYNVPFYVCAPTSTIDMKTADGADIVIEERGPEEVTEMWYRERMAPEGVKVYNPAFDITDADLITAIITEYGVARPPYTESLRRIFEMMAPYE